MYPFPQAPMSWALCWNAVIYSQQSKFEFKEINWLKYAEYHFIIEKERLSKRTNGEQIENKLTVTNYFYNYTNDFEPGNYATAHLTANHTVK